MLDQGSGGFFTGTKPISETPTEEQRTPDERTWPEVLRLRGVSIGEISTRKTGRDAPAPSDPPPPPPRAQTIQFFYSVHWVLNPEIAPSQALELQLKSTMPHGRRAPGTSRL